MGKATFELQDGSDTVEITAFNVKGRALWLSIEGYGELEARDGCGLPVGFCYDDGKLEVWIYDDINQSEPRIISLEGARETNRREENA